MPRERLPGPGLESLPVKLFGNLFEGPSFTSFAVRFSAKSFYLADKFGVCFGITLPALALPGLLPLPFTGKPELLEN